MADLSQPAQSLVLYGNYISPNTWRVGITLVEKGLQFSNQMPPNGNKSPEHLSMNPRGQVPVLKDGNVVINESFAQILYLEKYYPEVPLMPTEKEKYGPALGRLLEVTNLISVYNPFMLKGIFGAGEVSKSSVDSMYAELARWDGYLSQQSFLAGDSFTLADAAAIPMVAGLVHVGVKLEAKFPNLSKWYQNILQRPSVKNTWPFKDNYKTAHPIEQLLKSS